MRICVITRGAHDNGGLPCAGADAIWSFVRVAINEYPALDIRLVDLAPDLTHAEAADALLRFLSEPGDEREVMIDRGGLSAPRVSRGVRIEPCPGPDLRAVLETDAGASLDDFAWRWRPRTHPGPDEIEVEVEATGLNFPRRHGRSGRSRRRHPRCRFDRWRPWLRMRRARTARGRRRRRPGARRPRHGLRRRRLRIPHHGAEAQFSSALLRT